MFAGRKALPANFSLRLWRITIGPVINEHSFGERHLSYGYEQQEQRRRRRPSGLNLRLIIAIGIIAFSVISYLSRSAVNPVTGERQRVSMTEEQEMQLGQQAAPAMIQQHGGLHASRDAQAVVDTVGARLLTALQQELVEKHVSIPYQFEFHLLADPRTVNAFALPGGQVFITFALFDQLETEGQLAGVLGHEIGHVIERHGAERMAKQGLWQGLAGAAGVFGGDVNSVRMAQMVANFTLMKYGRDDELESDRWAVMLMSLAGYDPRAMLGVMDILDRAAGGGSPPEILSTHPKPQNRKQYIDELISEFFPKGLPPGLRR
jgi:predicted Zn-dependent protease